MVTPGPPPPARPWLGSALALVALLVSAWAAWNSTQSQSRLGSVEQELVRRQEDAGLEAKQAALAAREAQVLARDSAAKTALFDARLGEAATQRVQVDEALARLARSRNDDVVADLDASLRVAQQQAELIGSTQPLVDALRSADERLQLLKQARYEPLHQAIQRDLSGMARVAVPDTADLAARIDQVLGLVDELPLRHGAAAVERANSDSVAAVPAPAASAPLAPRGRENVVKPGASASVAAGPADGPEAMPGWRRSLAALWAPVGQELHQLVRISPIVQPDSVLVAPEQTLFLRENLKLRLLNARLAVLARKCATMQSDLLQVEEQASKYFDPAARKMTSFVGQLTQLRNQCTATTVPHPDQTLAYIQASGSLRRAGMR